MGTIKPTIYLLKEDVTDPKKLFKQRLQSREEDGCILYYKRSRPNTPDWAGFVLENFELNSNPFNNSSSYAVVVIKVKNRYFAIPFGMGVHLMDLSKTEYNFGLKTAINAIPKNEIRQLDTTKPEQKSQKTKRLAVVGTTPEDFEINKEKEILRGIVGKVPKNMEVGEAFEGRDSLRTIKPIGSLKVLKQYVRKIYKLYQKQTYKTEYPWIDNISLVRDKKLEEDLNKLLVKELKNGKLDEVYVIPPVYFGEDNLIKGFAFTTGDGTRVDKKSVFEMPSILDWKKSIGDERKKITIDTLSGFKIHEIKEDGRGRSWSLERALSWETDLNDNRYILSEGSWYEVSPNFYDLINSYFQKRVIDGSTLLPTPTKNKIKESEYNKEICDALKGRYLFDLGHPDAKVKYIGKDQNEACDVYDSTTNTFIHVKMGKSSFSLSHLFQQGNFSGIVLRQDEKLLDQFIEHLQNDKYSDAAKLKPLVPSSYNILFVSVVAKNSKKLDIPFFSKVTFYNVANKSLEFAGYKCRFAFVRLP
ncbi:DUF6119 family protein [Sphingobacterium sp. SGR-19]|uniref:DUF6119 family protein n=1 Tax=Sphingobacterium sp. SGR-19 TaxID=2710886 RepID=UPI0013EABF22|nr:DUF6119 family protein [Sphingobacterium sp. SGR-19]NGM64189.1 hypothetical protein [Sphingobacterium sp. SGR-19]